MIQVYVRIQREGGGGGMNGGGGAWQPRRIVRVRACVRACVCACARVFV